MNNSLILKNISKHIHLNEEETEYFKSILQVKKLKKKELLIQPGMVSTCENFINLGCMRVYTVDEKGFEHNIYFAVEDWWIGDFYSFITGLPANCYIEALEDTELIQIYKPDLEALYQKVPKFERFFRILIQRAFISQQERINQNLSFTAEQKYLYFINKYPHLEQRLTQKMISSYLGITPEFLRMLRRKLAGK